MEAAHKEHICVSGNDHVTGGDKVRRGAFYR
jgi:hypothetical protein